MKTRAQTSFVFKTWGGKRKGAGRPRRRKGDERVEHRKRPVFAKRFPLHVTVRMREGTWGLRSWRSFSQLARAFYAANDRFGMRLCHFAVMGNHIHFLVEAGGKESLAKAMQGLGVRIARAMQRVMGKPGSVYADRYHARLLKTPTEVSRAKHYVLQNARHHGFITAAINPVSSA